MILAFEFSELAIADLGSIWHYTSEKWSKGQANKYYKGILSQIDLICSNPEIGRSIETIKENHRIFKFKSHLIIYKRVDDVILVDRILHLKMDVETKIP